MSGDELKSKAAGLDFSEGSGYSVIRDLIVAGFLDQPVTSADITQRIGETTGTRWATSEVHPYFLKFMKLGIVCSIKPNGSKSNYWVLASVDRSEAQRIIAKGRKIADTEAQLFAPDLIVKLQKNFAKELSELHDNFGRNGDSTAFLLRKILEKLLIIVFSKLSMSTLIEDKARPGGWKGLKDMLEIAAREKHNGMPILTGKTANEVKGIKFLGDSAAHNPLANVDITAILPQMPYIIMAYSELAIHL